jgi:hypothetical protein
MPTWARSDACSAFATACPAPWSVARAVLTVTVELVDTRDERVVWADRFAGSIDDVHAVRAEIRSRVLAALEIQIPLNEALLARLTVTENLDAWSAYHLGLQHMYRFNREDNAAATALFRQAVARDPGFARAPRGPLLRAFPECVPAAHERSSGRDRHARRFAERGVELDGLDPFVNFAMGRTFWLERRLGDEPRMARARDLDQPNYAQGIYARAWTETLAGRGLEGRGHVDLAMRLLPARSPLLRDAGHASASRTWSWARMSKPRAGPSARLARRAHTC